MKVNTELLKLIASKIKPGNELKIEDVTTEENKETLDYELTRLEKQGLIKCMSLPYQGQNGVITIKEITSEGDDLLDAE